MKEPSSIVKKIGIVIAGVMLAYLFVLTPILMWIWSSEPDTFNVEEVTKEMSAKTGTPIVSGSHIMAATIEMSDILLRKSGGYISNDIIFPSILMDNIPSWEFGVVEIERVVALTLRKDFSRSQSQSTENKALILAQTAFNNDHSEWVFPSAESKFEEGENAFKVYVNHPHLKEWA